MAITSKSSSWDQSKVVEFKAEERRVHTIQFELSSAKIRVRESLIASHSF